MHQHLTKIFQYDIVPILKESIPWKTVTWGNTGRPLPRKVQSMDTSTLIQLVPNLIEVVSYIQEKHGNISSVWMNLYSTGNDYCPYHRDSYDCTVVTVSFGASREFKIKDRNGIETSFMLGNGDIFIFDQAFNREYQHSIPKITPKKKTDTTGSRVSIVFFCQ